MAAMYAARFPDKVNALVLAGSPIDTRAGDGALKHLVDEVPTSFFEEMVELGGGLLRGQFMLEGWKNMHPEKQYFEKYLDLYEHLDDTEYVSKADDFESWYENPIDLPGRWYLQAIVQLFKENRLAKGRFVGLGRKLSLGDITCPVYLLAGDRDGHHAEGAGLRCPRSISARRRTRYPRSSHPAVTSVCSWASGH